MDRLWIKFLLIAASIYIVLIGLFNLRPVEGVFNTLVIQVSEAVLSSTLPDAQIDVVTGKSDEKRRDPNIMQVNFTWTQAQIDKMTQVALDKKIPNISVPHRFTKYYIYQFFSIPIILFFALFLATPIDSIAMKFRRTVIGLMILSVFLWLKLFILVLFSISNARIGIYELHDSTMQFLVSIVSSLTMGVSIVLVILLWGVLALPKSRLFHTLSRLFQAETK